MDRDQITEDWLKTWGEYVLSTISGISYSPTSIEHSMIELGVNNSKKYNRWGKNNTDSNGNLIWQDLQQKTNYKLKQKYQCRVNYELPSKNVKKLDQKIKNMPDNLQAFIFYKYAMLYKGQQLYLVLNINKELIKQIKDSKSEQEVRDLTFKHARIGANHTDNLRRKILKALR